MPKLAQEGHAAVRTKRRVTKRRDPRVQFFGFTARQWPFLYVLVGNWLFALFLFFGAKFVWHWTPEDWSLGDRIALVIKDAVFAILPAVIGICIVAAQRLDPNMWVGRTAKPNSALDINTRFILNTFEQFVAYFIARPCPISQRLHASAFSPCRRMIMRAGVARAAPRLTQRATP